MADDKKLQLVDLVGIGNLLEHAVAENAITCEERDRIILRIANDNGIAEHKLPVLAGYNRSKDDVLERAARSKVPVPRCKEQDNSYISLTEIARTHSEDAPGYVIQSWLRSGNTLAFLNLWESENNPDYWVKKIFFEDYYVSTLLLSSDSPEEGIRPHYRWL